MSNLGFYLNGKKVCEVCHSGDCFLLHTLEHFYCCLDVPVKYITKTVREWVCDKCIIRKGIGKSLSLICTICNSNYNTDGKCKCQ